MTLPKEGSTDTVQRGEWSSRLGFVLAAAGSAVGLGNIWKFPYITGANGGGLFVLVYIGCVAFVGIPILAAEVLLGRASRASPVGAFRKFSGLKSPWIGVGILSVLTPCVILSYYSVVAGWCADYVFLAASGGLGTELEAIPSLFGALYSNPTRNLGWHVLFMGVTAGIVVGGVRGGVERASRLLMPTLLVMLVVLLVQALFLPGFSQALDFIFTPRPDNFTAAGALEALGHAFFTLSVGMGAMLTYGSYLSKRESLPASAVSVGVLDTLVALGACLVIFPITFSYGLEPAAGAGLVFQTLPLAFAQMPLGSVWAAGFFLLLFFAALTSGISLLEVSASFAIDQWGIPRRAAAIGAGTFVFLLGIPSALSGGEGIFGAALESATGRNWFDWFDHAASNWFLPIGGLGIATFVAWRLADDLRQASFVEGTKLRSIAGFYRSWLVLLRYVAPIAIVAVFLHGIGVF